MYQDFVAALEGAGYSVTACVVDGRRYGVPQTRKRLVLFASLLGPVRCAPPTHPPGTEVTVREVIGGLEPLAAGQSSETDSIHRASALSDINLLRIAATPPGGGWRDWPESLRLDCHRRESGRSYPSVYGRMPWDAPAPTITTQCHGLGNGRFGHPEQDRAISLREAALLQTFPPDYEFVRPGEDVLISQVARLIGNAVPVELGEMIGKSIRNHLEAHYGWL